MKIKRETWSTTSGIKTQTVVVEGTTLKKLAKKYPDGKVEPNGNLVLVRDGFILIYSKK